MPHLNSESAIPANIQAKFASRLRSHSVPDPPDAPFAPPWASALNMVLWVIQIAVAAKFFLAGLSKLIGELDMIVVFQQIGIGQWFRYVIGTLEVAGAIALLFPQSAGVGGLVLAGVMAGAVVAHLFIIGGSSGLPLALLSVLLFVAWARFELTERFRGSPEI
jgi:putative oxidoreductase